MHGALGNRALGVITRKERKTAKGSTASCFNAVVIVGRVVE